MARADNIHRAAYRAALVFAAHRPWRWLDATDFFAVHLPGEPHPWVGSVVGAGVKGLLFFRGPEAVRAAMSALAGDDDEGLGTVERWSCSFQHRPPRNSRWQRRAQLAEQGQPWFPVLLVQRGREPPREPRSDELNRWVWLFYGLLAARAEGHWVGGSGRHGQRAMPALAVSGEPESPEVTLVGEGEASRQALAFVGAEPHSEEGEAGEAGPARGSWLVGCFFFFSIWSAPPGVVRVLVVQDAVSGRLLAAEPVEGTHWRWAAAAQVGALVGRARRNGLGGPRELRLAQASLADALSTEVGDVELRADGQACRFLLRRLDQCARLLRPLLGRDVLSSEEETSCARQHDRTAWHEAAAALIQRGRSLAAGEVAASSHLGPRFFGSARAATCLAEGRSAAAASEALLDYAWLDYRADGAEPTLAETMMVLDLPPTERALLRTLCLSSVSLYRLERVGLAGEAPVVTLSDLLGGGTVEVYDPGLPDHAEAGSCFSARLYRGGRFTLLAQRGPVVPPGHDVEAAALLRSCGGGSGGGHCFGRLWPWSLGI